MNDKQSARIENNFKYHAPNTTQINKYFEIRESAKKLAYLLLDSCPFSHERDTAIEKLEESVMWANSSIARYPNVDSTGAQPA